MKSKLVAIAFAVGVSTLLLRTKPIMASESSFGVYPSNSYSESGMHFQAPRTWYLTGSYWIASDTRVEAEIVFGKGRINAATKGRLAANIEILLSNPPRIPDATAVDAVIHVRTATCRFTSDPRVTGPFALGSQTLYKVEFQGAVSQSGTDAAVSKGLDCGGLIPAVEIGDAVTAEITGLPWGSTVPILSGKFEGE